VFASYLIGLREGLEATLVVTILVAFLVKSGRKDKLPLVWAGVGIAVALSLAAGGLLTFTSAVLGTREQELFEGIASLLATVFVTFMIFWMKATSRRLSAELRERLDEALRIGTAAVVVLAFVSVVREGLETALLWFAAAQGAASSTTPLVGVTLGLLTAVAIGWGLYRSVLRIDLGRFFTWTGLLLILVAAGIVKYGVHDLQEAGVLPGLTDQAFDISGVLDPGAWYTALLTGMFNITAQATVLETIAWALYAVPVLVLFLLPARRSRVRTTTAAPAPPAS